MADLTLKSINYQIGKLCRLGSRKVKLMAISNRRKQQLRHLGERVYIFKALQQDDDIWEKDEISQLLLTIADLDQEQEMIIDEINEIKAESPPEDITCGCHGASVCPEPQAPVAEKAAATESETPESEAKAAEPEIVEAEETATAEEESGSAEPNEATPRRTTRKKGSTSKSDTE
ncbi:MAG: hypothetical protein JXR80_09645 [Deltaproteobacteria bacterium]|nr:hypothetical protein [Deltaproteobacteria bacterium]